MDTNPYRGPQSRVADVTEDFTHRFRDLSMLSKMLSALLLIGVVMELLGAQVATPVIGTWAVHPC